MIPPKLKPGDEVRIIAPSRSMAILSEQNTKYALEAFEKLGLKVSFGKHVHESDEFVSSSIESRVEDIHEAFKDKNVKAIFTVIGGFNSNQLLKYIDYNIIKENPKIFCGYSDITALHNAIYHKTDLVMYHGPHFSSLAMQKGAEYIVEYLKKAIFEEGDYNIGASKEWSDDSWYKDQENREFISNEGYKVINEGEAEGKLIGGNLCTFALLQGTEYMPSLKDKILMIEEDDYESDVIIERMIQSLIHQPEFDYVKAIIIGRFQKKTEMTDQKLYKILNSKKELEKLPIIANVDFGHTTPMATFPIGGLAKIRAYKGNAEIIIKEH